MFQQQLPGISNLMSHAQLCQQHPLQQQLPASEYATMGVMHKCDHPGCDRQFNRKYTLAEHAMTHTGEKPHVCPVKTCGKSFSTSGNLSRHKRLHGYIEPLACPVQGCICSFPSTNKLVKHMKFHFASDDVKVCMVVGCGKTFSTTGNLNRHMKAIHGCDSDDSGSSKSVCSSPVAPSTFVNHTRSPTAADQWAPQQRVSGQFEPEAPWMNTPATPQAAAPPQQYYLPPIATSEEAWNADVFDALATILDDHEAVAGPMSALMNCNVSVFQNSLQFTPSYNYRC